MDGLMAKYLADACTPDERRRLEEWIAADARHAAAFEQAAIVWHHASEDEDTLEVDIDAAWKKQQQLQAAAQLPPVRRLSANRNWMRAAAAVVVIAIAAILFRLANQQAEPPALVMQTLQSTSDTAMITLPDGTAITLNKQSSLVYPATFTDSVRKVSLQGEAFFDVAANASQPFIIEANGVEIRVVGTSFNVKTSPGKTAVIVEEGIVKVQKQAQVVSLTQGQQTVVYDTSTALQVTPATNQLYQHYRSQVFVCDDTPLPDLIAILNETYGVRILLSSAKLQSLRITTTFNNASLDDILEVIALTFDLSVDKQPDQIILR